jgi:rhamnosyl/mannosyltransferase
VNVLHLGKFDTLGGIERHVRSLATGLAKSGSVQVVNLVSNDRFITDRHTDDGYLTVRAACAGTALSLALSPTLPWLARSLDREFGFDIVHLHFPDPLGQFATAFLPARIRRVISWHSDIVRQKAALAAYGPLQSRFVARADALIAATPQHYSSSRQIPPDTRGQLRAVIPYAFDPAALPWTPGAQQTFDALLRAKSRPAIFAVGRHVYYKGFDVLIDAMREIDAVLWIGGDGPLTADFERRAAEAGIADRVVFTGRLTDEALAAHYAACDVFAMPSTDRSEAFGIVQLEAMHFGRPVLSTRLGTGVEFVNLDEVTGLLVPPRDAHALALAIRRLLADDALRERLGRAGRARVAAEFGVDRMVAQTLDVYRRVLSE